MVEVVLAKTAEEIAACYDAFKELRPHLKNVDQFLAQVKRQQAQSYQIVYIQTDNGIPSAAGFRFAECLAWGNILYIDDLSTCSAYRGRGYGSMLMDWLINHARSNSCNAVHLDTGYARHAAHKLYLKKGLELKSHHLSIGLAQLAESKITLDIKVVPGSSKDSIAGWMGDVLRIKVMAPPENGKANQAVERVVARVLGLSLSDVNIVSGKTSPSKVVEIRGLDRVNILQRLAKQV